MGVEAVTRDAVTMDQSQQSLGDPVNEDVMGIPPVEVSQSHGETNNGRILAMVAHALKTQRSLPLVDMCSPNLKTMAESPAMLVATSPPAPRHILSSPEVSSCTITLVESPAAGLGSNSSAMSTCRQFLEHITSSPEVSSSIITLAESPASVVGDPGLRSISPASYETSGHTQSLPLPTPMAQSLKRVCEESEAPPKKRRGRKPKSSEEKANTLLTKPRKLKVYEIDHPFEDKEMEEKRLNAVKARRHRVHQKEAMKNMEQRLTAALMEIEFLKRENTELKSKVAIVTQPLEAFQRPFGILSMPYVTFVPMGQQLLQ